MDTIAGRSAAKALTLTPEIEAAVVEQARAQGTTPEKLALDSLRHIFVAPKATPDDILKLAGQVYTGLSEIEIEEVEQIALDRSHFVDVK